jgi:predicted transcriptional regulator
MATLDDIGRLVESCLSALGLDVASRICARSLQLFSPSVKLHRNCNARVMIMKSATIPSLRVDPELRADAESVLKNGETLSAFVEDSLRRQVHYRKTQAKFIARGLASLADAERTGRYHTSEEVLGMLKAKRDAAKAARAAKGK